MLPKQCLEYSQIPAASNYWIEAMFILFYFFYLLFWRYYPVCIIVWIFRLFRTLLTKSAPFQLLVHVLYNKKDVDNCRRLVGTGFRLPGGQNVWKFTNSRNPQLYLSVHVTYKTNPDLFFRISGPPLTISKFSCNYMRILSNSVDVTTAIG